MFLEIKILYYLLKLIDVAFKLEYVFLFGVIDMVIFHAFCSIYLLIFKNIHNNVKIYFTL